MSMPIDTAVILKGILKQLNIYMGMFPLVGKRLAI